MSSVSENAPISKFIGTYKDGPQRAMNVTISNGSYNYKQENCSEACKDHKYFGLQDENSAGMSQCFCSDDYGETTKYGKTECGSGGGPWCNAVYENVFTDDIKNENIVSSLQSLQNLEKQLHNQLNQSLINNSASLVSENIYIGTSTTNSKSVPLPNEIKFTSFSNQATGKSGTTMVSLPMTFTSQIETDPSGGQVVKVTRSDSSEGWSEPVYINGSGTLKVSGGGSSGTTKDSQADIINKINKVAEARVGMFKSLNSMYDDSVRSSANARNDLVHQITALKLVENELKNAKRQINAMRTERDNKLRVAELNMNRNDRYNAYVKLVKMILFVALPVGLLYVLINIKFFANSETSGGYRLILKDALVLLMILILVYGLYKIILNAYDISIRNNMNFNAYDFDFNARDDLSGQSLIAYDSQQNQKIKNEFKSLFGEATNDVSSLNSKMCAGASCCSTGMTYNSSKGKCVSDNSTPVEEQS